MILGIIGSPRKRGNTEIVMKEVLKVCEEQGLETQLIHLAEVQIKPCDECMVCKVEQTCPINDDLLSVYEQMKNAKAIVLGSPVFFSSATAQIKSLIDRAGYLGMHDRPFEKKIGGAIVVGRRAGHNFTLAQLLFFFLYHGMIIPGSIYWNMVFGKEVGEIWEDKEGLEIINKFAKNLAWLVKKLN